MAQWIGDLLLLLAFGAAFWYSVETRKMRLQMIRPKLVFLTPQHHPTDHDDTTAFDLAVANVGNGTAINVSVERVQDSKGFKLRFEPEHFSVLRTGEQVPLEMLPAEGSYQPNVTNILDEASVAMTLLARYVDVEGHEFRTSTAVGGGAKPPFIRDE